MSRHRFLIWPKKRPDRYPPRWTDWLRLVATALVVVLVAALVLVGPWLWKRLSCRDGIWPDSEIWEAGDECVGLSAGSYTFDLEAFAGVLKVIEKQNASAADKCYPNSTPVTVGVLMTMTDQYAGARAVHELEGMAAGQLRANGTGCLHPMKLLVGQLGAYGPEQEAIEVAHALADHSDPDGVVAVAGIGLSHERSAEIANLLAAKKIPMVSDLITAEGLDQGVSGEHRPDFRACDLNTTYHDGIGKDHYYRVAFPGSAQIAALGAVAATRPEFIMVPTGGTDPYTCTALPLMQRQFGGNLTEVKFDPDDPSTVPLTARRICDVPRDVTVAYIARGRDLAQFLHSIDEAFASGQCSASSVTVVSTSDGQRVRAQEHDTRLEDLRVSALTSPSFTSGKIRLISPLVGGADKAAADNHGFVEFERMFTAAGFDIAHIDAGWAVNGYDAVSTIAAAVRTLPANAQVQRSQVNTKISGFSSPDQAVLGAGGPMTFDNNGNRKGTPPVVRVCPLSLVSGGQPGRVTTVTLRPGVPPEPCRS